MASESVTLRNGGERMRIGALSSRRWTRSAARVRTWGAAARRPVQRGAGRDALHAAISWESSTVTTPDRSGYYVPVDTRRRRHRGVRGDRGPAPPQGRGRRADVDACCKSSCGERRPGRSTCARPIRSPGHLYENHGFWYRVGDGMRFTGGGRGRVRRDISGVRWRAGRCGDRGLGAICRARPSSTTCASRHGAAQGGPGTTVSATRAMSITSHASSSASQNSLRAPCWFWATPKEPRGRARRSSCAAIRSRSSTWATLSLRVAPPAYMEHAGASASRAAVDRAGAIGVSVLEFPDCGPPTTTILRPSPAPRRLHRGGALAEPHPRRETPGSICASSSWRSTRPPAPSTNPRRITPIAIRGTWSASRAVLETLAP